MNFYNSSFLISMLLILSVVQSKAEREIVDDGSTPKLRKVPKFISQSPCVFEVKDDDENPEIVSDADDLDDLMDLTAQLRLEYPEEYNLMDVLLRTEHLKRNNFLKDIISVLVEFFVRRLPAPSRIFLGLTDDLYVDEEMVEGYRNFTELLEEEFLDYVVPINFLEVIRPSKETMDPMMIPMFGGGREYPERFDVEEFFEDLTSLPHLISERLGYPMKNISNIVLSLIMDPENKYKDDGKVREAYLKLYQKFAKRVHKDHETNYFPGNTYSILLKAIINEVPEDLREAFFDPEWHSNASDRILELIKSLNYEVNLFTFKNLDEDQEKVLTEFAECPRCQRIVLHSILKSLEIFLQQGFNFPFSKELSRPIFSKHVHTEF